MMRTTIDISMSNLLTNKTVCYIYILCIQMEVQEEYHSKIADKFKSHYKQQYFQDFNLVCKNKTIKNIKIATYKTVDLRL